MKTKNLVLVLLALALLFCAACGSASGGKGITWPKGSETNEGRAHFIVNVNDGVVEQIPTCIDDIIPAREALITALQDKGYEVMELGTAIDPALPAQRVYAHKGRQFVDICYGLTVEQAKEVLLQYGAAYADYVLLAQNEKYAYCISDKEAFDDAGFTSLANIGTQYIRPER